MNRVVWLAFAAGLSGCARIPDSYAPPIQRIPIDEWAKKSLKHFVNMDQGDALNYAVEDVVPTLESGGWRWTMKRPAFQFMLPTTQGLKLRIDHSVAGITFQQTGPVKIAVYVEGRLLETESFEEPGEKRLEKAIPAEWLSTERPVMVRMEIDKMWTSPTDGVQRGFIVTRLGFVQ